jgi:hypothetical protein
VPSAFFDVCGLARPRNFYSSCSLRAFYDILMDILPIMHFNFESYFVLLLYSRLYDTAPQISTKCRLSRCCSLPLFIVHVINRPNLCFLFRPPTIWRALLHLGSAVAYINGRVSYTLQFARGQAILLLSRLGFALILSRRRKFGEST